MKENFEEELFEGLDVDAIKPNSICSKVLLCNKIRNVSFVLLGLGLVVVLASTFLKKDEVLASANSIKLISAPIASASVKRVAMSIPSGTVKANPFLPYREMESRSGIDVPTYNLIEPPEDVTGDPDAIRVMDTIVSGILFDKFSPSAILNIEGSDYLVKKNDVDNNYKVVNIAQDSVTVKLGNNVYKAGIGEILTEGEMNYNEVSNLSSKFGGENND